MRDSLFARSEMLLGSEKMSRLSECSVILFGLGGVGSYTAETLARGGVGFLTLVDSDTVSETNRNRQLYSLGSTTGRLKTEVARERIQDINPDCHVEIISEFYLPDNGDDFFKGDKYDFIADAVDTVTAKLDLVVRAKNMNVPIISCMGTGNKLDVSRLMVSDIYSTSVCPLCRVMRRELRARGIGSLKVIWSDEEPLKPVNSNEEKTQRRSLPGSLPFVPPVAGILMAREIILDLIGDIE